MIYLDNAATTLHKPPQVAQAIFSAMHTMGNCARGTHKEALDAARRVYAAREKLAALFGCPRADHVIFTCNATEALNIALNGLFAPGDHVITTDLEHNSVLRPLYRLEAEGKISLSFVPANADGCIAYEDFERLMTSRTRAVVCTHASNLTGNALDISRIASIAHRHGALCVIDASQTAGCLPINMETMGLDVVCFTGHKGLMGPQGTGGLCIRPGVEIAPFKVGGTGVQSYSRTQPEAYPTRLEAGTLNGHGIAGLGAALDFILETGVSAIHAKEKALMEHFYTGVREIPGVTVYGDFTHERAAIVSLNIREYDSGEVADALSQEYAIATRPGAHCAPRMHYALGTQEQGAVRFSFAYYNTEDEVDTAIAAVKELAQ